MSWMRWEWNVACMGEKRNAQRVLLGKQRDNQKSLEVGRQIFKWILWTEQCCTDWIYQAKDREQWQTLVNIVINLWVPQNGGKFLNR